MLKRLNIHTKRVNNFDVYPEKQLMTTIEGYPCRKKILE